MTIIAEPLHARHRDSVELDRLIRAGWPEFIFHDEQTDRYQGRVRELFAGWEWLLLDSATDSAIDSAIDSAEIDGGETRGGGMVAAGWGVPLRWSGEVDDLPGGYTDSLARALRGYDAGEAPDTLAILAAQVRPDRQGTGLAGRLLTRLCDQALGSGLSRVICPVRPTHKSRYPLTPIERYARWTRGDGTPLDPWLRTHVRLGARILAAAPASQTITGTVARWQEWTGLTFPDSGDYVIPDGLSVLHIDSGADRGSYTEPNVWVRHR